MAERIALLEAQMASKGGEWAKTNQPHPAAFYGPQKGFAMFSRLRDRLEQLESQLEPIQRSAATMGEALSAQQGPRRSCPSCLRYSPSPARPSRARPLLSVDPPLAVAQLLVRALRLVVSRAWPSGPAPPPQVFSECNRRRGRHPAGLRGRTLDDTRHGFFVFGGGKPRRRGGRARQERCHRCRSRDRSTY